MRLEKILASAGILIGFTTFSSEASSSSLLCPEDEYGVKQFCLPIDHIYKYEIGPKGLGHDAFRKFNKLEPSREEVEWKATGLPKKTVKHALSLGSGGWVIGGYTRKTRKPEKVMCFVNRDGFDFYVQEPSPNPNIPKEEFKVYVGIDPNPETTKWVYIGKGFTDKKNKGYVGFDMGEIKKAYWIKIVDNKSERSTNIAGYGGFDLGTILLRYPCFEVAGEGEKKHFFSQNIAGR